VALKARRHFYKGDRWSNLPEEEQSAGICQNAADDPGADDLQLTSAGCLHENGLTGPQKSRMLSHSQPMTTIDSCSLRRGKRSSRDWNKDENVMRQKAEAKQQKKYRKKARWTNHATMDQFPQPEHLTVQRYEQEEPQESAQHQQQGHRQEKDQKGRRRTKTDQARQQLAKKP
jgi:hypothetical protein